MIDIIVYGACAFLVTLGLTIVICELGERTLAWVARRFS